MIDASALYRKGRNQNTLEEEHVEQILSCYKAFDNHPGISQVVLPDESPGTITTSISRAMSKQSMTKILASVDDALKELKTALQQAYQAEDHLLELLKDAGLVSPDTHLLNQSPIKNKVITFMELNAFNNLPSTSLWLTLNPTFGAQLHYCVA